MGRAYISNYMICRNLDDRGIRAVSGALLHGLMLDQPIPFHKWAEIVYARNLRVNVVPATSVIKMARREHVDAFFREGLLFLGTFDYYNKFDHEEIGDRAEGWFLLVGHSPRMTALCEIAGGFDNHVFCCFAGNPDDACIRRFGYDSSYEIKDVVGFARAVGARLGATAYHFGSCAYSKHKVIVDALPPDLELDVLSHLQLEVVNHKKYFVKPNLYSHQSEFRFIWQMEHDLESPILIRCPEAIQYCRRS